MQNSSIQATMDCFCLASSVHWLWYPPWTWIPRPAFWSGLNAEASLLGMYVAATCHLYTSAGDQKTLPGPHPNTWYLCYIVWAHKACSKNYEWIYDGYVVFKLLSNVDGSRWSCIIARINMNYTNTKRHSFSAQLSRRVCLCLHGAVLRHRSWSQHSSRTVHVCHFLPRNTAAGL